MLNNKVVLITGAKGGLGTYVTHAFLEAGASVIGVSRSISASDFAHAKFSAQPAELSSALAARTLLDQVISAYSRLDAVVHLVGAFAGGSSVVDTDEATFDRMIDMNLRSAFHLAQAALPHMQRQKSGRFLAIASRAAAEPGAMTGAYSASKAALVSLVRTIALENRATSVTANVILPGTMDTPVNRAAMPQADFSKWVNPDQVAALLVHLASDAASHITGAAIPVYGPEV